MYIYIYIDVYIYVCVCYVCVCVYTFVYVCMCVCVHIQKRSVYLYFLSKFLYCSIKIHFASVKNSHIYRALLQKSHLIESSLLMGAVSL